MKKFCVEDFYKLMVTERTSCGYLQPGLHPKNKRKCGNALIKNIFRSVSVVLFYSIQYNQILKHFQ